MYFAPCTNRGRVSRRSDGTPIVSFFACAGRRVEQVQVAGLLVDDVAAAGAMLEDREVVVLRELRDLLRFRVVGDRG